MIFCRKDLFLGGCNDIFIVEIVNVVVLVGGREFCEVEGYRISGVLDIEFCIEDYRLLGLLDFYIWFL